MEKSTEWKRAAEDARQRCQALEEEIESLRISSTWKGTLLRLVHSELSFLNRFSLSLLEGYNLGNSNPCLSVNVGHLESVVHILQHPHITGVSRVCKPVASCGGRIYVDIICCLNGRPVWFVVSDRNPKYISWTGSSTNKGLKTRIQSLVKAAQFSETLRPSSVILLFSHGLDETVHEKLREEFGASDIKLDFPNVAFTFSEEPEDGWINILTRWHRRACVLQIEIEHSTSDISTSITPCDATLAKNRLPMEHSLTLGDSFHALIAGMKFHSPDIEIKNYSEGQLINFDTTALVAIVSGISNGGISKLLATPKNLLRDKFKGNIEFVLAQVDSEIQAPILVELTNVLAGKDGIVCESVCSEFQELVSMYGGPNEKLRANLLLKCLKTIPDSPSARMMSLPTTRKLAMKNKVVFGTGDHWRAPTLTANGAFVRAVFQTCMSLFTIEHRPRALIGD